MKPNPYIVLAVKSGCSPKRYYLPCHRKGKVPKGFFPQESRSHNHKRAKLIQVSLVGVGDFEGDLYQCQLRIPRSAVVAFYRLHQLQYHNEIVIEKTSEGKYSVYPYRAA